MKKKNNKSQRRRDGVVTDWQPLFAAVKDVIDWALDIAVKLSREYDDDIDAIEKVRTCFHAWLDGRPCEMETHDLLLTVATILSAIEVDLGIESVELLAPLRALNTPQLIRFPGATRDERATVVIRNPRRRNACGALAA